MTTITNNGIALTLAAALQTQQNTISQLSEQLATGVQHNNLTDYSPTDAHNLLDFQNAVTQRQSYITSMNTVNSRLTVYDTTMTDMEGIASQAADLASQNQTYTASAASNIQAQAQTYLSQMTDDLNQSVGGRYVYAGTRYTTAPVTNLTTLTGAPTATTTTSPALPSYDSQYDNATSFTVNATPTGTFKVGNLSFPLSSIESPNVTGGVATVTVSNSGGSPATYPVNLTGLAAGTTTAQIAGNLASAINQIAASTSTPSGAGIGSLTASASASAVTLNFNGTPSQPVTPDVGGVGAETTWNDSAGTAGTKAQTPNSSAAAYTQDTALVDSGFSITYGVTSNDPSFQKIINGLRFISNAVTAGQNGDSATYQADMVQANNLLNSGLASLQAVHSVVANNINTIKQQTTNQNTDITNLQNELTNIQQVNLSQVGTEINLLQTQLQASYSSTASLEQLSLVKYL